MVEIGSVSFSDAASSVTLLTDNVLLDDVDDNAITFWIKLASATENQNTRLLID